MAITTYSELQTAIGNWLNRTDLTSRIPEFIALAEADMRRNLRNDLTIANDVMAAGSASMTIAGISGIVEIRGVWYNTSTYQYALKQTTLENLATLKRTGSGVPLYYAVGEDTLYFDIAADTAYAIQILAYASFTALSTGNTTNAILTSSPDLYLYGALKEAELYLEHDERNPIWAQKYQQAVRDENDRRERAELGGAPKVPGLPMIFG